MAQSKVREFSEKKKLHGDFNHTYDINWKTQELSTGPSEDRKTHELSMSVDQAGSDGSMGSASSIAY